MILRSHNAFPRWHQASSTQYEFIVVNGQTTTFAFHKVVQQRWSKLRSLMSSFFVMLHTENY